MKVLIVNPGATSTKIAVFEEEKELFKVGIDHSAEELNRFERIIDQADFRREAILEAITAAGVEQQLAHPPAISSATLTRCAAGAGSTGPSPRAPTPSTTG